MVRRKVARGAPLERPVGIASSGSTLLVADPKLKQVFEFDLATKSQASHVIRSPLLALALERSTRRQTGVPSQGILCTRLLCFFAETRRFTSEATCYVRKPRDLTMRRVSKILSSSSASYVFYRKERSNAIF